MGAAGEGSPWAKCQECSEGCWRLASLPDPTGHSLRCRDLDCGSRGPCSAVEVVPWGQHSTRMRSRPASWLHRLFGPRQIQLRQGLNSLEALARAWRLPATRTARRSFARATAWSSSRGMALEMAEVRPPPAQPRQELLLREQRLGPSRGSEPAAGLRPERPPGGWRALWSAWGLQPRADRLCGWSCFGSGELPRAVAATGAASPGAPAARARAGSSLTLMGWLRAYCRTTPRAPPRRVASARVRARTAAKC